MAGLHLVHDHVEINEKEEQYVVNASGVGCCTRVKGCIVMKQYKPAEIWEIINWFVDRLYKGETHLIIKDNYSA